MLRSQCDAILVGSTTLFQDNPTLNIRYNQYIENRLKEGFSPEPAKVAISKLCDIDINCNFLQIGTQPKYIFTTNLANQENIDKVRSYAKVFVTNTEKVNVHWMLEKLWELGIHKMLLEGGGSTNFSFISQGVVDEIRIAIAPMIFGGANAPTLVDGAGFNNQNIPHFTLKHVERMGEMVILRYMKDFKLP